jgi:hypothetical protein
MIIDISVLPGCLVPSINFFFPMFSAQSKSSLIRVTVPSATIGGAALLRLYGGAREKDAGRKGGIGLSFAQ